MQNDESNKTVETRLGVVGLGQCGGNIAATFAARGYPVLAANTSVSELRSHIRVPEEQRIVLDAQLESWHPRIAEAAALHLGDAELVMVVGGLGGATGGLLGAVVNILIDTGLPVIATGVLPAKTDSFAVRKNALMAINALLETPFESLLLVDNHKLHTAFSDQCVDRYLDACNAAFVHAFERVHRVSVKEDNVPIRSFEQRSFRSAMGGGGVAVFGERELDSTLTHEALLQAMVDIINHNPLLATEYELEDVVSLGSIVIADEEVLAATPAAVFDTYFDEVNLITGGITHDVGIYRAPGKKPRLQVLASGLALPSGLQRLLAELTDEAERVNAKRTAVRGKLKRLDLSALPASLDSSPLPPPSSSRRPLPPPSPPPSKRSRPGPPPLSKSTSPDSQSGDDGPISETDPGAGTKPDGEPVLALDTEDLELVGDNDEEPAADEYSYDSDDAEEEPKVESPEDSD